MPLINHAGGGSSFAAIIQVTYTKGATCTCELDGTVYTAPTPVATIHLRFIMLEYGL